MIFQITSRSNPKIKALVDLRNRKTRQEKGLFVSEGKKNLEMAKEANILEEVYTLKEIKLPYNIKQYIVSEEVMDKISLSVNPEGVVFVSRIPHSELEKKDKLLYLDNLQDPGNVGTLIRTALALGFDGVYMSSTTCDPFNDKAISSSKGAIFKLPVGYKELSEFDGLDILVTTLSEDSIPFNKLEQKNPFILVLGNEGKGVSNQSLELATKKINIPMKGIDSLNVAVAGGIMMYYLVNK